MSKKMTIISTQNPEQAKSLVKVAKPPIIIQAQSPEFNRKLLEYGKFQILLLSPQTKINHVLANLATKNKIALGIDLSQLSSLPSKQKALFLENLFQIIKTSRKAKTQMKLLNYKDKRNAQSFLLTLKASSQQAKQATIN
jgi:RNase P/RNase MRP subunit p30